MEIRLKDGDELIISGVKGKSATYLVVVGTGGGIKMVEGGGRYDKKN